MTDAIVHIVDDEEPIRDSIALLLRSAGLGSRQYQDAHAFLATYQPGETGCLVLDVRMPRMTGLELQQELNRRGWTLPVIFVTGHGDVPMAVEAMREGALDFLQKPFNDEELIRRVHRAIEQDQRVRHHSGDRDATRQRLETLTPREREIAERIVVGQANKVIAMDLSLSERTVELHRARVMQKMGVRGVAQLVQLWIALELIGKHAP
ncbi:LuxR family two component transcriptional regulator [Panacagrimonas perspica]|uniref:LuxR family two component transcriptional regulator n=1 Tax=Panacagrimonas perspica TaxID=381431 RepID=A0A4S3K4W3_9GAMM|nr:response regulator transcription factor [Panacagrimonas perspica]TDU31637.1 LuxR family two component transcriptional regulator [Panacagrimonas perspica]THD03137.1 DNA-binding response regulator [Panacagrimonas perspica]